MKSVSQMICQLEGLLGTADLTEWEQGFVRSLVAAVQRNRTDALTEKQLDTLERIYGKHFA